jgi:amino acid adenylation domain-containing protein
MAPDLPAPLFGRGLAREHGHRAEPMAVAASSERPLLAGQTAAWLDARSLPNKPVYTTAQLVTVAGPLDRETLAAALALAVDECDALRARLRLDQPVARRDESVPGFTSLPFVDLTAEDDPELVARRWAEAEFRRPFRLDDFPLCRFALLRLAPARNALFLAFHTLVMDGIGRELFTARVAELYAALRRGQRPEPRVSPSFTQRRAAEASYLESPAAAKDRLYWLDRLRDPPEALVEVDPALTERTRSGRAARGGFTLPVQRADELRATARELGTSTARLMTGLVGIAFARWYDRADLTIAVSLHNRAGPRLRHAIGPFAQVLPLRLALDRGTRLAETIRAVHRAMQADMRHHRYPVHELRAQLGLSRAARRIADVAVNYLPTAYDFSFDGASIRVENVSHGFTGPWTVTFVDPGKGRALGCTVDYDPGLVPSAEGEQLIEALRCLVDAAPTSLATPTGMLSLMRPETAAEVLRWSSGQPVPLSGEATLFSLFAEQAARSPDAIALVCGEERMDYGMLFAQAARLARRLVAAGVGRGSIVGIALPRTPRQLVALLATHMVGAAYLPLDPGLPAERVVFMCSDAQADLVLTSSAMLRSLPPLPCRVAQIDIEAELPPATRPVRNKGPSPDDLAYVLYTSGSSGQPKGVGVEHATLVNFIHWVRSLVDAEDLSGVLLSTPLAFDISVIEIFLPLCFGGRIIMVNNILGLPTAPARNEVRLVNTVPSLLEALLRVRGLPPGLRTMFLGGEALSRDLADRLLAMVPALRLTNMYGPTEATVYASHARVHPEETGTPPIGRPIWNGKLYVLDADGGLMPPGAPGELCIGGLPVARGYLNRAELNEARFRPDPFHPGRIYRTGDRVRWRPDRQLEFLGRLDDQIKINGVRIELGEVDAALLRLPGVAAAAAGFRTDDTGSRTLVGWLVAERGIAARDNAALRADLRAYLPEMLIPLTFVWVETLPLTPSGKLDRRALPSWRPAGATTAADRQDVPLTPMEQAVAKLWERVLKRSDLAAEDDFFDLGGDSLAAVNLLTQVELHFGVRLTTDVMVDGLSVARLARLIENEDSAEQPGLALALQPLGDRTPFYCVPGIGGDPTHLRALARRLGVDRPFVALRGGLHTAGEARDRIEDIAGRYVDALLERHDAASILLGGYSLGAAIAYEMAHQLRRRGREPALLVLIDTQRPDWRLSAGNWPAAFWQFAANLPNWIRDDLLPGGFVAFARNLRRHARALVGRRPALDQMLDTARYSPKQRETMARFHAALQTYQTVPYDGRIVVLRARAQPVLALFEDTALGWRKLAGGGVELHLLPGNHATIMSEPIVGELADRLRRCIERAEAGEV